MVRRGHGGESSAGRVSVPQFGEWEEKGGSSPNYSMLFGQARENRRQIKKIAKHHSLGSESELSTSQIQHRRPRRHQIQEEPITKRRTFLSYLKCCVTPY